MQISAFHAILSTLFFSQNFDLHFDLDLHHGLDPGLDCEVPEVPPTACDPPGCQKWPFEAAWAISFWPGPRPPPGLYRNAVLIPLLL